MDEKKDQDARSIASEATIDVDAAGYSSILEIAPFPTLASLNEITATLSRRSQHANKEMKGNTDFTDDIDGDKDTKVDLLLPLDESWRSPNWLVVLSTFLVNFSVSGFCFCWGVFQKVYLKPDVYGTQTDSFRIAFVGTSANACMMCLGLFIYPIIVRIGYQRTMAIGTVVAPLGLILASFATQLWQVYLAQGLLYGIGATFVFSPSISLPSHWFDKRRAFATGIAVSGSGIGGVCLSPLVQKLISALGYRNALRVMGALIFGLLCIATALAKARFKPAPSARPWWALVDTSLFKKQFNLFFLFCFLVPFGFLTPFFLAPTYASYIGVDEGNGAALVSIMSATNAVCRIILGYMGDRFGRLNIMFSFTFVSAIFTMLLWQFSDSYGMYVAYALLFGLSAGAFVSMVPSVTADIVGIENIQYGLGMAYGGTTPGTLLGTPISGLLLAKFGWSAAIQCCGALTMAASLIALALRMIKSDYKIFAKV